MLQITTPPDVTRQKALEILLSIISFRSSGTKIMTLDQRFLKLHHRRYLSDSGSHQVT